MTIAATSTPALVASVVAVLASGAFVATILRHRSDPTTLPLIGLAITLFAGVLLHLAVVDLAPVREFLGIRWGPTEAIGGFWILVAFDVPAVASGFWFLFALQYTGRDRHTSPVVYGAIAVLLLLLVAPSVALALVGSSVGVPANTLNAVLGITIVLAESMALIGLFLILATTFRHKAFPPAQTGLLALAIGFVLALPFAATTLQNPIATPIAVAGSSLFFTVTVRRYRIFETLPVVSEIGRDHVIDEMSEGVLMIDEHERVRDLNPTAESLLNLERPNVIGESLDDVAPELSDSDGTLTSEPTDVRTDSGRIVTVTADTVSDDRGRDLGHLLVCRDVTDERTRERRLGLLTQLVAGATQEQMVDVRAIATAVAEGDQDPTEAGERIRATATDAARLVARVRDVERALAERNRRSHASKADVMAVVSDVAAAAGVEVRTESTDRLAPVGADQELLTSTLKTLVTGAQSDAEPVHVWVTGAPDGVTVDVAPFEQTESGSIPDLSLEIARIAAEHSGWSVDADGDAEPPVVTVGLSSANDAPVHGPAGSDVP